MNADIVAAIRNRRRLSFIYNGRRRIVEPQCHGSGTKGTELLRGYQIHGGSQREPLFDVAKISDLVVLDEHFHRPGPHYKPDDSAMTVIFAQLETTDAAAISASSTRHCIAFSTASVIASTPVLMLGSGTGAK